MAGATVGAGTPALGICRQGRITRLDRVQDAPPLAVLTGDVIEPAR